MKTTTIRTTKRRFAAVSATALSALTSFSACPPPALACPECTSPFKSGTYTGEAKRVGNGVAYSWVTLDTQGKPAAIGVTLTETALEGLSLDAPHSVSEMERDMYPLMLPKQALKTAFDHISLDWNAKGHAPSGIYDKPHFDVHFYTIDMAAREKITATGADVAVCRKPILGGFAPTGYVYAAGTEAPMMGGHWINPQSPELFGKPFTSTFIYGSYNGSVAFVEPMVTRAFLQSAPNLDETIALPTEYAKSAYYPTRYTVHLDPVRHEVTIALEGMVWRTGVVVPDAAPAPKATPRVVAKLLLATNKSAKTSPYHTTKVSK